MTHFFYFQISRFPKGTETNENYPTLFFAQVKPYDTAYLDVKNPKVVFPMGEGVPAKAKPSKVVILAMARCPCPIRRGWKSQTIDVPHHGVLSQVLNSTSESEVEGSSDMAYIKLGRITYFQEYRDEHIAALEAQKRVRSHVFLHKGNERMET